MLGTKLIFLFVPLLLVEAQIRRYGSVNRSPYRRPGIQPTQPTTSVPVTTEISENSSSRQSSLTIVYPENYSPNSPSRGPVSSDVRIPSRRPNGRNNPNVGPDYSSQSSVTQPTVDVQNHLLPRFPPFMNTKPPMTTQPPPPPTTQPPPPPTTQPPPPTTTLPPPPPTTQPPPPPPPTTQPLPPQTESDDWQSVPEDSLNSFADAVEASDEKGISEIGLHQSDFSGSAWQSHKRPVQAPPAINGVYNSPKPTASSKPKRRPTTTSKPWSQPIQSPHETDDVLSDYVCKNRDGYEAVPNKCDSYIECRKYQAVQNTCPDGLHFNPAARYPQYACAYPSEVTCESQAVIQEPQPSGQCPHRYGFYSLSSSDCSQYISCQEGLATIMTCPPGLAFSSLTSSCDWPANVPGCNPDIFQGFTCPAETDLDYQEINRVTKYRYKNSCAKYIACQKGRPRLLSCDVGMSFDSDYGTCIDADEVQDCEE